MTEKFIREREFPVKIYHFSWIKDTEIMLFLVWMKGLPGFQHKNSILSWEHGGGSIMVYCGWTMMASYWPDLIWTIQTCSNEFFTEITTISVFNPSRRRVVHQDHLFVFLIYPLSTASFCLSLNLYPKHLTSEVHRKTVEVDFKRVLVTGAHTHLNW